MKLRLLPREEKFYELFKLDAENVKKGVEALKDLVDHYEDIDQKFQKIKSIEHQGDEITHEIITKLRGTFITPLEREDIHELASGLDDVLDCIEGVASRLYFFKIARPTMEIKELVGIINAAVEQIYEAVLHLGKLGHMHSFCREVNSLEYKADLIGQKAIADLFEDTKKVEELKDLIKLKEIYGRLETAADRCEDVANVLEGIMVKSS
jgi:predicted phosphate transport protein (TIGR00153 family)